MDNLKRSGSLIGLIILVILGGAVVFLLSQGLGPDAPPEEQTVTPSPTPPVTRPPATATPLPLSSPTPTPIPTTQSENAYQLTTMLTNRPWWSDDSQTLYFSSTGSKTWQIDITTKAIQPAIDTLSPQQLALSLTTTFIPAEVSPYSISISSSGRKVIFSRRITTATTSVEQACDGEICTPIPINELWWGNIESRELSQFQIEGELSTLEINFSWSANENYVVISVPPSWVTHSDAPTIWIADLPSGYAYPIEIRDNHIAYRSISPNGDYIIFSSEDSGTRDTCDLYLWAVEYGQEAQPLPMIPCTPHFWLDEQTIVFHKRIGQRSILWEYDIMTTEQRSIAKSTILPERICSYVLAPDKKSVAVTACFPDNNGIWLITLLNENGKLTP